MKLINAYNIKNGGGVSVLYDILESINEFSSDSFIVLLPNLKIHRDYKFKQNIKIIYVPSNFLGLFYRIFILKFKISFLCKKYKINKIYTLGNIAINTRIEQVLLIQNAYPFLTTRKVLYRFKLSFVIYILLKNFIIIRNLKYANTIFVQTHFIKEILVKRFKIDTIKVKIFPNQIAIRNKNTYLHTLPISNKFNLLFLSNYYPHKNFSILFSLVKLIYHSHLPIRISVTLNGAELKKSKLNSLIKKYPTVITNIGNICKMQIEKTYHEHDALFLPSIIESFSTNYVEAFFFEKTIITSKLPFATEICQDTAFYFDPFDENDIFETIRYCFENQNERINKIKLYHKRINDLCLNQHDQNINYFLNS